jgi:hypothetical protein
MRRHLPYLLCAAGLVLAASNASATTPMIDWDTAQYIEAGATPTNSIPGAELHIVGLVSGFGPPLDFLNANIPAREYTLYAHSLISMGTTSLGPPSTTFYTTPYAGGVIEIYEDLTPDASFDANPPNAGVPADFTDGVLILSGVFMSLYTETNNFTMFNIGHSEGNILWTGGLYLPLMRPKGSDEPCPGLYTGVLTWRPDVLEPGYLFRHDGKIDFNCPVPARPTTWGAVKSLYR